jgi:hypothetical protein
MTTEDQLTCNICNIKMIASQAKQHASASSHELNKSRLEEEINAVRNENYHKDTSVANIWQKTL